MKKSWKEMYEDAIKARRDDLARIRDLEAALGKAVDTFEDIATAAGLLRRSGMAEAARIASVHCREVLATAETPGGEVLHPAPSRAIVATHLKQET